MLPPPDEADVSSSSSHGPAAKVSKRARMMVDAMAGALSGCISRVVVGPLDVIKIRCVCV